MLAANSGCTGSLLLVVGVDDCGLKNPGGFRRHYQEQEPCQTRSGIRKAFQIKDLSAFFRRMLVIHERRSMQRCSANLQAVSGNKSNDYNELR